MTGLSARFPTARSMEAAEPGRVSSALPGAGLFWHAQLAGSDLTTPVPYERWNADSVYDPKGGIGKACVLRAGTTLWCRIDCMP